MSTWFDKNTVFGYMFYTTQYFKNIRAFIKKYKRTPKPAIIKKNRNKLYS